MDTGSVRARKDRDIDEMHSKMEALRETIRTDVCPRFLRAGEAFESAAHHMESLRIALERLGNIGMFGGENE